MILTSGKSYTCVNSSIVFNVIKVQFKGEGYLKVKACITDLKGNMLEGPKNYKLQTERIKHWIAYDVGYR